MSTPPARPPPSEPPNIPALTPLPPPPPSRREAKDHSRFRGSGRYRYTIALLHIPTGVNAPTATDESRGTPADASDPNVFPSTLRFRLGVGETRVSSGQAGVFGGSGIFGLVEL